MGRAQQRRTNEANEQNRTQTNQGYSNYITDTGYQGSVSQNQANQSFGSASDVYGNLAKGFQAGSPGYGGGGGGFSAGPAMYQLAAIDPNLVKTGREGYDEYAKTGGWDEARQGNFRLRGNAQIPAFYNSLKDSLARGSRVQGGYGGFNSQLARQAAQQGYQGQLNTEGTIQGAIDTGRQFGISGAADLGKFSQQLALQRDVEQGGFYESAAQRAASAAGGNAKLAEAQREFDINQDLERRQIAGAGFSGLYGEGNNQAAGYSGRQLAALGGRAQAGQESINSQYEYNRPWGQQLANSLVGGLAGAAGSYLSGGATSLIRRKQPTPQGLGYG
jgi:hypothetical protein